MNFVWEDFFLSDAWELVWKQQGESNRPNFCFLFEQKKIFLRKPESVFTLEERRDQKVSSFANRIQRFFTKFALQNWYYDLQMSGGGKRKICFLLRSFFQKKNKTGNKILLNNKERRRVSVEVRKFGGDYINFRENFDLKKIVENREKVHFADMGNK